MCEQFLTALAAKLGGGWTRDRIASGLEMISEKLQLGDRSLERAINRTKAGELLPADWRGPIEELAEPVGLDVPREIFRSRKMRRARERTPRRAAS